MAILPGLEGQQLNLTRSRAQEVVPWRRLQRQHLTSFQRSEADQLALFFIIEVQPQRSQTAAHGDRFHFLQFRGLQIVFLQVIVRDSWPCMVHVMESDVPVSHWSIFGS